MCMCLLACLWCLLACVRAWQPAGLAHELDSQVGVQWVRAGRVAQYYHYRMGLEVANLLFLGIFFGEFLVKVENVFLLRLSAQ